MTDYQAKTIREIRQRHPEAFAAYLDDQIAHAYHVYCEQFHAAGWTDVDFAEFVRWAKTPPIDALWRE